MPSAVNYANLSRMGSTTQLRSSLSLSFSLLALCAAHWVLRRIVSNQILSYCRNGKNPAAPLVQEWTKTADINSGHKISSQSSLQPLHAWSGFLHSWHPSPLQPAKMICRRRAAIIEYQGCILVCVQPCQTLDTFKKMLPKHSACSSWSQACFLPLASSSQP